MHADRWLLPRRQTEYPARELVAEERLHGRREATFLALSTLLLIAIASLVVLTPIIDVSGALAAALPGLDVPFDLQLPLGVLPNAFGLVAIMLACELYGRRRAAALVWAGAFASAALLGLVYSASGNFAPALSAGYVVALVATIVVFAAIRRSLAGRHLWLRANLAMMIALPLGWATFAAVSYALAPQLDIHALAASSLAAAGFTAACVAVATLPLALIARALRLYLRVAREDLRLPPAMIVEDDDEAPEPPRRRRAGRASIPPWSSAEMRFFTEGDQLESAAES